MVTVLHYSGNKDPDVYFGTTTHSENKILKALRSDGMVVTRSSANDWPGQDNPKYIVHHWDVKKG